MLSKKELFRVLARLTPQEKAELGKYIGRSLLSDTAIMRHIELGNIVVDPFDPENLRKNQPGNASYDVRLGEWYYFEQKPDYERHSLIYNPYEQSEVHRVWGEPQRALTLEDWKTLEDSRGYYRAPMFSHRDALRNLEGRRIIWIYPGETLLCHTEEFIGGTGGIMTTMMKARSSKGRNFLEVCKCAGWGDVGFINRWTMEVTNNSQYHIMPLVTGMRIAQITFFEVEPTKSSYQNRKYQRGETLEEVKKEWKPEMMLPREYMDYELIRP